jgi:hypothetical protein
LRLQQLLLGSPQPVQALVARYRLKAFLAAHAGAVCTASLKARLASTYSVMTLLGTNIAVFYPELGDPRYEKWTLTRRFWQDEPWSADVSALGWVPRICSYLHNYTISCILEFDETSFLDGR